MDRQLLLEGVAYADQWLAHQREFREIPGVVVAIQHDDDVLLANGYGFANLEQQTPMTPRHIFRRHDRVSSRLETQTRRWCMASSDPAR
jgi:hypothetical protein